MAYTLIPTHSTFLIQDALILSSILELLLWVLTLLVYVYPHIVNKNI